jgi:hypothetical protein
MFYTNCRWNVFIISYVNSLERRKYVAVLFSWIQYIHTTWQWTHSGKRLRMCEIVCWWRKHMAQIESWKNENIDGFHTKTTQKGGFRKLCVKIKKRCYTDLLHFSTRKHNLVSFFRPNRILTVELHRSFLYIVFFRRKWYLF